VSYLFVIDQILMQSILITFIFDLT